MNDNEIIERLGGVSAISSYFGMDYQRVFNWKKRGIPKAIKVDYPDIFMPQSLEEITPLQAHNQEPA
ncbi:hypothetical protein [Psychrobacter sp. I-STPA10]|uniref:hypothetical protein n=1 Tax=Psychrobacter sp. I-STPA10 TaxID=2585769 RepID=UPI001E4AA9D7|nr:hypothetical protein [Psychrobacter sp. I-STPA10]